MPLENDEAAGAQLTGSTWSGYPNVGGGIYYGSGTAGALPAYVSTLQTDISGAMYVTTSGTLPVAIIGTVPISVPGTLPVTIQNQPATVGVSGSVNLTNWPLTIGVSASINIPVVVQNQPATTNVSGTVGAVIQNWPLVHGVSGSVNVYTSGPQAVSGAVNLSNWPATLGVSASATLPVAIQNQPLTTNISGGVVIQNWPAVIGVSGTFSAAPVNAPIAVSGSQLTGSTFSGFPMVAGGVFSGSQYAVTALRTDISGALQITTTGSLPVTIVGSVPVIIQNQPSIVGVSGSVATTIQNWPAVIGISGTVGNFGTNVYTSGPQAVSGGVSLINWPLTLGVTASATLPVAVQNQPAVIGVSGSVNVYTSGLQGVSGSVTVGAWGTNVTASMQGAPGGIPLAVYTLAPVGVSGGVVIQNWPLTMNVSGTVALSNNPPVNVYTSGLQGVSGGIVIQNWPATVGVSGSLNVTPVYSNTPSGVTGSVNVYTSGPQSVSGSQLTGSTFTGFPVVVGGVYSGSLQYQVKALQTDVSGTLFVAALNNYGVNSQTITITLASLATSTQRQSTVVNNFVTMFKDVLVQLTIKTGASGVATTGITNIYAFGTVDGGTTYGENAGASDASITLTVPPNLKLIGTMNMVANATTYKSNPLSVAAAFGGRLPDHWGIVVENKTGGTYDATAGNFKVAYQGVSV